MSAQSERSVSPSAAAGADIRGRFRPASKLLRHADFERVYQQGRRYFAAHMTLFYVARVSGPRGPRFGLTVGRVLGGAVERNRIKRRLREAIRASLGSLAGRVDVVINPKKSVLTVEFSTLRAEVGGALAEVQEKVAGKRPPRTNADARGSN